MSFRTLPLLTEGLYGEEQKETEIGLIPKSWEVVRLGDYLELIKQYFHRHCFKSGKSIVYKLRQNEKSPHPPSSP